MRFRELKINDVFTTKRIVGDLIKTEHKKSITLDGEMIIEMAADTPVERLGMARKSLNTNKGEPDVVVSETTRLVGKIHPGLLKIILKNCYLNKNSDT